MNWSAHIWSEKSFLETLPQVSTIFSVQPWFTTSKTGLYVLYVFNHFIWVVSCVTIFPRYIFLNIVCKTLFLPQNSAHSPTESSSFSVQNLQVFQYLKAFLKCCGKQRNQGRLSKFSFWSTNSHVWLRSQTDIGDYKTVNLVCRIYLIGFAVLSLSRPTLKIWIIIKGVKSKNKFSDNLLHSIMKLN